MKDDAVRVIGETVVTQAEAQVEAQETADRISGEPFFDGMTGKVAALPSDGQKKLRATEKTLRGDDKAEHADDVKDLSNEVVFALQKESMRQVDVNNDGLLEKSELTSLVKKLFPTIERLERMRRLEKDLPALRQMVQIMDQNKDGYLERDEVIMPPASQRDIDRFKFADQDGDGKLSAHELFYLDNPQYANKDSYYKYKAEDHMKAMDMNKDGVVTWPEFSSYVSNLMPGMSKAEEAIYLGRIRKVFMKWSITDHKGTPVLRLPQMQPVVRQVDSESAFDAVVSNIISQGDDNGDGNVSLHEIISHAHEFGAHINEFMTDPSLLVGGIGHDSFRQDPFESGKMQQLVDSVASGGP